MPKKLFGPPIRCVYCPLDKENTFARKYTEQSHQQSAQHSGNCPLTVHFLRKDPEHDGRKQTAGGNPEGQGYGSGGKARRVGAAETGVSVPVQPMFTAAQRRKGM